MNRTAADIGDELYALAPPDFTAARDTYVAEAKTAGNRALASELAAMKRPSLSAGLVNLVALRQPDSVTAVVELGQTIRDAQGNVTPIQLRDLSAQRRQELDAVVALAVSLAAERGDPAPSRAALTEVESTFAAAMADDDAASLVRRGRVLKALSYSGFGQPAGATAGSAASVFAPSPPAGRSASGSRATPASPTPPAPTKAGQGDAGTKTTKRAAHDAAAQAAREAAERAEAEQAERRAAAQTRAESAQARLTDTTTAEADAEGLVRELNDQIAELRNQLEVAQRDARTARQRRLAAERDLASAERLLRRHS